MDNTEVFNAEVGWFHSFKSLVLSGGINEIGIYGYGVLSVMKCYANFHTGKATIGQEKIAKLLGISVKQVQREIKKLTMLGHLKIVGKWRRTNIYQVQEKIQFTSHDGKPAVIASMPYISTAMESAVKQLKIFKETGKLEKSDFIHIENLQVNINYITDNNINFTENLDALSPELGKAMRNIQTHLSGRKKQQSYTQD